MGREILKRDLRLVSAVTGEKSDKIMEAKLFKVSGLYRWVINETKLISFNKKISNDYFHMPIELRDAEFKYPEDAIVALETHNLGKK